MQDDIAVKSVPLRRRLLYLAAAGILPIALMSGLALLALFEQQRNQAARTGQEIARALSIAIDADIQSSFSALQALANSTLLDADNVSGFSQALARTMPQQPNWRVALLIDPAGVPVVHTDVRAAGTLPHLVERESFESVMRDGRPLVGFLAKGPAGDWAIPLRVPVVREGRVRYVLTAAVRASSIVDIVRRQRLPDDWVITVLDGKGQRIVRLPRQEQMIGTPASATLMELLSSQQSEGMGITQTTDGLRVYTAYARAALPGWSVALGVPESAMLAGARRSLATYGAGILLSILVGALVALFIARSINRPIALLRGAAQAVGRGEPPNPHTTGIREIRDVAEALVAASAQRAQGEAEREELLRREQAARAVAEAANRAKDEFLAMLGHELRNPMSAISNAAALLLHPSLGEEGQRKAAHIISRQVGHLTRLTDDLLDAGRAITGKVVLQRRAVNLAQVASQALATLKGAGRTSRHRLVESYAAAWIDADPVRIDQVIANLVINAVKYTPPGGIIRVSVEQAGESAVLTVADDGIGLEPELAARVFDLFVQGDRDLDRALGGLGIGLTLVRRLAELHGGTASVTSAGTDQGSEFRVAFPAIEPPDLTQPVPAPVRRFASRDILVVEDNADARETLQRLLELAGHVVRVAGDGTAGLQAALAEHPEVALIDIGLPLMDGYEVARRIRAAEAATGRRALLIAVTGYGLPEDRERALAAGFDAHVVKPVDSQALEELLASTAFGQAAE